jgi:proline-specific peptidase
VAAREARAVRVDIGDGVRLWFDVEGLGLVPDGDEMGERPTLLLLHGGPGMDHSTFKPAMSELADICQIVYYDHRGNGRSDRGRPEDWHFDVWADDVVRLCDALGIARPIVLGNSFGGMVAMRYLARHPDHPSKVVLSSTAARMDLRVIVDTFRRLGGDDAAAAAEAFWTEPTAEHRERYLAVCGPLYTQQPGNVLESNRIVRRAAVLTHFVEGEQRTFDLRADLAAARCPVLLLAGALDPVTPLEAMEEIRDALPPHHVRWEVFDDAGHGVYRDSPERTFAVLRDFILS